MSPRRRFRPGEDSLLVAQALQPRPWGLPVAAAVATLVAVLAIALSTLSLVSHVSRDNATHKDQQAIGYVKWFMEMFTSVDPYHANEYVDKVLAQATGDFAKQYTDQANQILFQVARAERATGTVLDAGVERWNDDGSVNILVATDVISKSPDEKQVFENTNRWTATARQEGNQWKISNLAQVI
ncbi:MAG: mammalian cell entry protein [Mycobacterium sp.]|uniref:mammalian cell entry protein n=1 Tax=Mycobacterium sp. TaxID=1785 RepID=UPI001ECF81BA|nr:mammalian cell entry protein [Mycobacterium sp.]MBW0016328.1 mammalian cell entry protein [Mycobacterium sp.]